MEKMFNQYKIKEYGSNFDKNVFDCDKIVFDQYEYYEALEIRAVDKKWKGWLVNYFNIQELNWSSY